MARASLRTAHCLWNPAHHWLPAAQAPGMRTRSGHGVRSGARTCYASHMTFPRQVPGIPLRSPVHELETDVVYAEVDGVPLRYDHYRPLGRTGPVPAVVFVHGGGWMRGDPSQAAGN